jgi:TonB-linked SusC/RagA family outer membrane protein
MKNKLIVKTRTKMRKKQFPTVSGLILTWNRKSILTIKLIALVLLFPIFRTFALNDYKVYGEDIQFTFKMENVPMKTVLRSIEEQTEFSFVYNSKLVDVNRKVNIDVSGQNIDEVLDKLFADTNINYEIVDRHILLSVKNIDSKTVNQQQATVRGRVQDTQGNPLPGVTVVVKGTTQGTITDTEGRYSLPNVPNDAVLVFSFVGMQTQEIPVENRQQIDIVMEEEVIALEEVVAIGYGTQLRREVTGSIANVSEKDFNRGITQTAADLLQGKVPGLVITSGSGDITSGQTIRLRGTSSLTGSSAPFVVIDGVPGMDLNSVAPQDIESISVLKDASATAIYGSRSASGVILVTTKKGKADQTAVEYNGFIGESTVTNVPDVLSAKEYREYCASHNINTEGMDLGADTNWFDEIMRTGFRQNHNLSLSGGGKNNNYRASLSYFDLKGVVKDNSLQRYNVRLTFNQKALNDLLNISFTGSITQRDYSPTDTRNFVLAYNMLPVVPVKFEDGTWYDTQEFDQGNPVRNIEYNSRLNKNSLYFGNIFAELNPFEGFTAAIRLHKQRANNDYGLYYNSETERGRNDQGFAQRTNWTRDKELLETTVNYETQINDHKMTFLGGYSYEDNYYQNSGAQNRQFVTDFFSYNNLQAGENLRPSDVWSGKNMNRLISFFGRATYNYSMRYLFEASIRRDGSSKFGANQKWATFPAFSAAWRIKEESFLRDVNSIDELKLRVGYGTSGNQEGIDPYQSLQLYGASGQYYDNGKWYRAYRVSQNANPDLKWEETSTFNVGLDFSFLNNRISGAVEYYDKRTKDLLYTYQVPVPPYLYNEMLANVGSMSNKGVEFLLTGDIIRKSNLRWTASVNMAHNKNRITKLSSDKFSTTSIKTGSAWIRGGSDNTTHIVEEGRPVGTFYGWLCHGLDENGHYILDDMIDGKPGLTNDDRTYIGCAQPKLTYGISNNITWKNWELNFFFRGVYGNDVLNFSKMSYATTQWLPGANVLKEALTLGLNDSPKYSSFYIEKGSFLRLDNASLSYSFDSSKWNYINRLRIYLTGQNLFTITNYTGLDPEVNMEGLDPGVEGREYHPKSRTISLGVNISF